MVTPSGKRPLSFAYRLAVSIVRPLMMLFTKRDWRGWEHLPTSGGFVVAPNHVSHLDPFAFAHYLYDSGHPPFFLGKESVFRVPVVGAILRGAEQIPVFRNTGRAADAFRAAVAAVEDGKCVGVYPEGTLTGTRPVADGRQDRCRADRPDRPAAPVIPVAQWGPQDILAPYSRRPRLLPRKTMHVLAGPPVDLTDLYDHPLDGAVLREATNRIMAAITALLEELRGEQAPADRFDSRKLACRTPATRTRRDTTRDDRRSVRHRIWGTAYSAVLADGGTTVRMWGRRPEAVAQINAGSNEEYLPGIRLPEGITATTDAAEAASGADIVVLAVPSQTLRGNLEGWAHVLPREAAIVSLMKGVELGTTKRMSEVIAEVGGIEPERIVVVSGPNLAREIALKQPAASVVACTDEHMAERVAEACAAPVLPPPTRTRTWSGRSSAGR